MKTNRKINLQDEIAAILLDNEKPMTNQQIAAKVNERKNYIRKDGSEVTSYQIHGRTKSYPKLFYRDGNKVGLIQRIESYSKNLSELSKVQKIIKEILEDNEDSLSTKLVLSEIKRRDEFPKDEIESFTSGSIYIEAKKSPEFFTIEGDRIGLTEWEEVDEEKQLEISASLQNGINTNRKIFFNIY
ncbi:MAG: hypothetical protein ABIJ40_00970 [Bacteroidota bacterium]